MLVKRVDAKSDELSSPEGDVWRRIRSNEIVLSPTPLDIQPTEYVRVSRTGRPYGTSPSMRVSAVHNGRKVFFRLVWEDSSVDGKIGDIDQFVDAAAVLFPSNGDAPLFGMGAKGKPVNAWFWRADWEQPKNVTAEGMGTTERRDDRALKTEARHTRGRWDVVFSRTINTKDAPKGTVALAPGKVSQVAFAVWQGSNQERAGIKAFSPNWQELELEA